MIGGERESMHNWGKIH